MHTLDACNVLCRTLVVCSCAATSSSVLGRLYNPSISTLLYPFSHIYYITRICLLFLNPWLLLLLLLVLVCCFRFRTARCRGRCPGFVAEEIGSHYRLFAFRNRKGIKKIKWLPIMKRLDISVVRESRSH